MSYYNGSSYTFTWDGRRLASVEKGLFYATFTYNNEGLRLSTTINGATTTYLYDGSVLIAEYAPNYTCVYIYDESGAIIGLKYISTAENSTWQTYFFEKNLQGDVIAVYSDTGTKLISYRYDAWGNVTTTYHNGGANTLAANNPIRYRSYYYDTALRMYYLQSRYYDPNTCRFINADGQLNTDHILGTNLYAYCYNNPVMYVDYSGNAPDWNLFLQGALLVGMGALAVAAAFAAPVSCLLVVELAYFTLAVAGATSATIGSAEVYESFTGDNPVKDSVGESAYDVLKYGSLFVMSMGASIIEVGTSISVCFVAGTLVKAAEGNVPIENIQVGDYVYAHNPETGETELKPVVNTFVNEATELVHVFADGEEIICTNEHPFYSPVKGWIEAYKLRAGDILVSLNGEYVVVEQVQHEILEAPIMVYNFEVEDFHTYFVGDGNGVLVHNTCSQTGSYEIIFQSGKNYVGKGSEFCMNVSARAHSLAYNDPVVSMKWEYAPDTKTAFVEEYFKMAVRGVNNPNTYNIIWSPGRSYFMEYLSR